MSQPHPSHSPPSATSSGQLTPPRKPLACLPCRQRKIGCDRHQPQCASCQRAGLQCSFPPRTRTRRATKATKTEELAKRLNRLEQVLGDLDQTGQVRAETDYVEEPGQTGSDNSWLIHTLTPREDDIRPSTEPSTRVNSYLGRSVWKSLSAHIDDILKLSDQASDADDECFDSSNGSEDDTSRYGFVFSSSMVATPYSSLHPNLRHAMILLEIYVRNVNPMAKLLHVPTLYSTVMAAAGKPPLARPEWGREALLFSIYFAAIISISDDECLEHFNESRASLASAFRGATEHALAKAKFLESTELITLQAFVIFVTTLRCQDQGRLAWNLAALTVRIANSIGLHRDGSGSSFSPFDAEMRRRLWWQICCLDMRIGDDRGSEPLIPANSFDTHLPLNTNDQDFNQQSDRPLVGRTGCTDMSFCLIQYEVITFWRQVNLINPFPRDNVDEHSDQIQSLQQKEVLIDQLRQKLESQYLAYCDMQIPLFWVAAVVSQLIIARLRLAALFPFTPVPSNAVLSAHILEETFATAVSVLEYAFMLEDNAHAACWRWYFGLWCQWHALAVSLAILCTGTVSSTASKAWEVIDKMFDTWGERVADTKRGALWRPIKKLHAKAQHLMRNRVSGATNVESYVANGVESQDHAHALDLGKTLLDGTGPYLAGTTPGLSQSLDASVPISASTDPSMGVNLDEWIDWNEFVQYAQGINETAGSDGDKQDNPIPGFWMW